MPLPLLLVPLLDIAGKVIDRVIPDKAAAEKAKLEMAATLQSQDFQIQLEQIKVNAEEAKSASLFVAGWRPFVGWVCGVGLAYAAIILPIAEFIAKVVFGYHGSFPIIDWAILSNVLIGMLGLAGMRTFEKTR